MTYDKLQEKITSYVLGELTGEELAAFEKQLSEDKLLQYEVKEFKAVAALSAETLAPVSSPAFRLSDDQIEAIEQFSEAPTAEIPAEDLYKAQRKEDSVLFSLSNLQSLADRSTTVPTEPQDTPYDSEMSGLVDIRQLIQTASPADDRDDDSILTSVASLDAGFAAPTLTVQKAERKMFFWKVAAAAGFLLVLVVSVIGGVTLMSGDKSAQDQKIAELMKQLEDMKQSGGSASDLEALQARLDQAKDEKAEDESVDEASEMANEEPVEVAVADTKSRKTKRAKSSSSKSASSSPTSGSSTEVAAPKTAKPSAKNDALDDLLGGSASKAPAKKKVSAKPSGGSGGAAKLSRAQVISGMNAVKGSVKRCGAGQSGTVKIKATISPAGRVTSATATGAFAGTPAGACAARAVKRAKFPAAQQSTTVTYPFKF